MKHLRVVHKHGNMGKISCLVRLKCMNRKSVGYSVFQKKVLSADPPHCALCQLSTAFNWELSYNTKGSLVLTEGGRVVKGGRKNTQKTHNIFLEHPAFNC